MTSRTEVVRDGVVALAGTRRRLADFVALAKPRVVLMVTLTTLVGYYLGASADVDYLRLVQVLVGTALAAGGTLALNQFLERDVDARMLRTRARPLPDGRLQPVEAAAFGSLVTLGGLVYLLVAVGPAAAAVTAATSVLYLGVYTPLKRVSPLCTVLGAVPGALPPVAGWVAARGELGVGAAVLFAILFLWQLPHTLAIARLYREDYARAGIRVLPVVDPDGGSTERQIVTGCLALHAAGLLPTLVGLTGGVYFFGALLLGALFLVVGTAQALRPSAPAARRVVIASVVYLPILLALMALDKVG
ncbi:MAG TPA: heme o synthase [Methylomirabilota bacterium]|nr:heme o synthase [Methylomirabilota bacterium]